MGHMRVPDPNRRSIGTILGRSFEALESGSLVPRFDMSPSLTAVLFRLEVKPMPSETVGAPDGFTSHHSWPDSEFLFLLFVFLGASLRMPKTARSHSSSSLCTSSHSRPVPGGAGNSGHHRRNPCQPHRPGGIFDRTFRASGRGGRPRFPHPMRVKTWMGFFGFPFRSRYLSTWNPTFGTRSL